MDVRKVKEDLPSTQDIAKEEESKLNDALIYNIIKKLELKMAMEDRYQQQRIPYVKQMPANFGKYVYSPYGIGYFITIMIGLTYRRFKAKRKITIQTLMPHIVIAFTINQIERYRGIMNVDPDLQNQYRAYQVNTKQIIEQKKRRVSWSQLIKKSGIFTYQKMVDMIKFKPIF